MVKNRFADQKGRGAGVQREVRAEVSSERNFVTEGGRGAARSPSGGFLRAELRNRGVQSSPLLLCSWAPLPLCLFLTTSLLLVSPFASSAQQSRVTNRIAAPLLSQTSLPGLLNSGTQISSNGQTLPAAWSQSQNAGKIRTFLHDAAAVQLFGVELLNAQDATKQPVQWFSQPTTTPLVLTTWHQGGYRYLDITQLAVLHSWQISAAGDKLQITTPVAKVQEIRQAKQPWGDRIVVNLDRPTTWQVIQQPPAKLNSQPPLQEWAIAINATTFDPTLIQSFNSSLFNQSSQTPKVPTADTEVPLQLETTPNLTTVRFRLPVGLSPRVSTLPNPNRLVIDIRPDAMVERDILWIPGLRWRQQFVNLGSDRFPVVWLEVNLRTVGLTLKPIWSEPNTLVGIAPLIKTAQRYAAAAAINGGFFNRNNQLPLGAIRRDGRWLSSPILNRGAIAWNEQGLVKIGRLALQESIITSNKQRLLVLSLNSGYVQAGIARYSSAWGTTYTPLTDNEIIVVVQNNSVTAQLPGGVAGITAFPIPANGYLLTLRSNNAAANSLPLGTLVSLESSTVPADFGRYPHILGAGPVLLQNRQIVLDAKAEGFSDAFIREKAPRSAICTTAEGAVLIAAVHNRAGGAGPTLAEVTTVMQQMGCVDALNLDGGSSTSLYLGGQLLNRSPRTAARVHNGLGIFLQPRP